MTFTLPSALAPYLSLPLPQSFEVQPAVSVVGWTTDNPSVFETATPHYFVTGDRVHITGVPELDEIVTATVLDATHFSVGVTIPATAGAITATRTTPVEPLTVAEGKLRAGLDWLDGDPRDALMQGFIAAARRKVEADTGLALLTQVRDIYWEPVVADAWTARPLMIAPAQSFPLQAVLGDRPSDIETVTITRIVSGFPSVPLIPPLLVQAIGLLTAHWATLGRDLASIDQTVEVPLGYREAIWPHTLVTQA
jgi:hypothetical protein